MAKGIYPYMASQDIIASFEQWGLTVEESRLLHPTPEFVENLYCACLTQVTGIQKEDLIEPSQDALTVSTIEDKDIYLQALTHTLLIYHLNRFAYAARIEDFSALDISRPTKDRTFTILSAFINFVKFTEQLCDPFINELAEKSEALLVERERVTRSLAEVERSIAEINAKRAKDEPQCKVLQEENNELCSRILAAKGTNQALIGENAELKEQKLELLKRKETLTMELKAVQETNNRIKGRIVRSPERVKTSISTMSVNAVEYKKVLVANEAKARDLQAKITALIAIEQDIRSCIDQLQVVEKETKSLEELEKDLAELKDQLADKKIEKNELQLKHERVSKQLVNAQTKLSQTQQRAADKKAANARHMDILQAEYDQMDVERKENDSRVAELRKEADEVEEKMAEHLKASEQELGSLLKEYWQVRLAAEKYMQTLASKLNMTVT